MSVAKTVARIALKPKAIAKNLLYNYKEAGFRRRVERDWLAAKDKLHKGSSENEHTDLTGRLVVSLTSYPARFPTLALTLKSLLLQTRPADKIVLWIGHGDMPRIPEDVSLLQDYGLDIRATEDLRSYTKLVPALSQFPGSDIVVCDDDTYYWPEWLETLRAGWGGDRKEVACLRAHKIKLRPDGRPLPYMLWDYETADTQPSTLIFPTGCGGVLFPAGVFDKRVFDQERFMAICASADDVWFYWIAALNGARFRKVGPRYAYINWKSSQETSLWRINTQADSANDAQIGNMIDAFGQAWGKQGNPAILS